MKLTNAFKKEFCINSNKFIIRKLLLLLNVLNQDSNEDSLQKCILKLPADDLNREYYNIDVLYQCVDKVKWGKYDLMRNIIQQVQ